jgi:biopolymer transport protein ExbD
MSRPRPKPCPPAAVDITPLIDIVFLLLVFFMSIWQAAHMEVQAELVLPIAAHGDPRQQQDRDRLVVNIDHAGECYVSNRKLSPEQLAALLAEEASNSRDVEGFARRPVIIRADGSRPWSEVRDIMTLCRSNSIWKLSLRTSVPKEEGSP